jgi:hypothetical protein
MTVALACCGPRLAALWDTAELLLVFERVDGLWQCANSQSLRGIGPNGRCDVLRRLNVQYLICGAMSGCTRNSLEAHGIIVQPWISGAVEIVLGALAQGRLADLLMPGCQGRGRCRRGGSRKEQ